MGAFCTRLIWGGDPDELNPISGLSLRDLNTIHYSWAPLNADAVKYGMLLFMRLFKADPSSQQLFKTLKHLSEEDLPYNIQFKAHVINVMASLNSAVIHLNQPEVVTIAMQKLGTSHLQHKVTKEQFLIFKDIVLDCLRGDFKANEQVLQSWTRFIDFIYAPMFEIIGEV